MARRYVQARVRVIADSGVASVERLSTGAGRRTSNLGRSLSARELTTPTNDTQ
jgi:hypothetical protein